MIRIPMPDRPFCPRCAKIGKEQIRMEYMTQEKQTLKDAENGQWSTETLRNARRKLNWAQRAEVRGLKDVADGGVALAETEGYANIEGQDNADIEV